jgi:hypothetical protein
MILNGRELTMVYIIVLKNVDSEQCARRIERAPPTG